MRITNAVRQQYRTPLIIVGGWTLFGLLLGGQVYGLRAGADPLTGVWKHAMLYELAYCYAWAAVTPLIFALGRRFPLESGRWVRNLPVQLGASLVLAAATKFAHVLLFSSIGLSWFPALPVSTMLRSVMGMLDYGGVLYWVVLLIGQSMDSFRRQHTDQIHKSQLQAQLAEAQLRALRMQMHPHFLFNALNSLAELIHQDPRAADRMLTRLSELLRIFLRSSETQEVCLEKEIDFLERYLEIQKIRFEERLTVEIRVDPETRAAAVPSLILQPLVENAILHGIANREDGRIEIRAYRENECLQLSVIDNGSGKATPHSFPPEGIGLQSTRRRLEQVYSDDFVFRLERCDDGGAAARILIPFRLAGVKNASNPSTDR